MASSLIKDNQVCDWSSLWWCRERNIDMNGHTPPLRLDRGDLTHIKHAHITSLPHLLLQTNLKGEEEEGHEQHRQS